MIIVADTSPINYLVLIDEIGLLRQLFGTVIIPGAVLAELCADGSPEAVKQWAASPPAWAEVRSPLVIDPTISLGQGETEAISLAEELDADLVLIDDRKARLTAIAHHLKVAGTINILESGARRNLTSLTVAFENLKKTNFRISQSLLDEIIRRNSS
jgi:predicted nucleic acid-binding protein